MDYELLGTAISIVKAIPGTAANAALAAQAAAEAAAERAEEHGYGISVSGTKLIISEPTGGD